MLFIVKVRVALVIMSFHSNTAVTNTKSAELGGREAPPSVPTGSQSRLLLLLLQAPLPPYPVSVWNIALVLSFWV